MIIPEFLNSLYNVSGGKKKQNKKKNRKIDPKVPVVDYLVLFVSFHGYDWQFVFLREESRMM